MAYHYRDGWYFERVPDTDGVVRIYHIEPGKKPEIADEDFEIDPDSWASIVASVSEDGETADTHTAAISLHFGRH